MKIGIVGKFDFHLECIPFLLEIFKDDTVNIYVNCNKYGWLDYCKTLHTDINIFLNQFNNILQNNDKIIKLTSNDNCLDNEKVISILHLNLKELKCKSSNYISMTPYISGDKIFYTFPIFNPTISYCLDKVVTFVGYYLNSNFDKDTINFIKQNSNYHFNFIIWAEMHLPNNYSNIRSLKNVSVYNGISTLKLIEIINSSKFIMSKKYINFDRFSGQLGLAISFEKPLIIDSKTQKAYQLPGFSFDKNYSELYSLDSITDKEYNIKIKEIQEFKKKGLENNINIFKEIT